MRILTMVLLVLVIVAMFGNTENICESCYGAAWGNGNHVAYGWAWFILVADLGFTTIQITIGNVPSLG